MLELAICDDDIILCNWLEQKLLHYGKANDCQISIEIYYSAEQLLNRLEEESYDMLFLDICLEHENGIDIGTEIRKKNYGKEKYQNSVFRCAGCLCGAAGHSRHHV